MASGGLAAAGIVTIAYPLDYPRTRFATDVGSEREEDFRRVVGPKAVFGVSVPLPARVTVTRGRTTRASDQDLPPSTFLQPGALMSR